MSRTDVHAPEWVKIKDPLWRFAFTPWHCKKCRLNQQACDIDTATQRHGHNRGWSASDCYSTPAAIGRNVNCGCPMCTGHLGGRHRRHADRVAWMATKRELLKTAQADLDDVDVEFRMLHISPYWG